MSLALFLTILSGFSIKFLDIGVRALECASRLAL
jgi:hypothetical protein